MSETIITTLITGAVSLICIFISSKNTRDSLTIKLDKNQAVMNNEIEHIKAEMSEMKSDIKAHNGYAKMFSENVPVIKEQIKVINHRISDLEGK